MLVEARQAFYSEETGAVSPWRDIEVTDAVGEGLIGSGLAVEVAAGGGGGGGIPAPKVTVTWKLDGVSPSGVEVLQFYGLVEESNGKYIGVRVSDIDTDEGNVSGICYPSFFFDDNKLFWTVELDATNQGDLLNVTFSDCVNCEESGGSIVITDTSSPAAFTATISNS